MISNEMQWAIVNATITDLRLLYKLNKYNKTTAEAIKKQIKKLRDYTNKK